MKNESSRLAVFPLLLIPFGGLISLGIIYMLYFGVYMLIETTMYPNNSLDVPAGLIRNTFALVIFLIYLLFLRTKWSEPIKAAIGVGPVALVLIAVGLALYLKPVLSVVAVLIIAASYTTFLYRNKKPWFYYYAVALSVLAAIFYSWPR